LKILHTADIHLRAYGDEKWDALKTIIAIGKKEKINVLVISGDLFDATMDLENLRPKIRDIFSNNGFSIVLIPGNHDCKACKDMFFGEDATLLTDLDEPFEKENVRIWGLPFENIQTEQVIEKLQHIKSKLDKNNTNIMLYHGELLDTFFSRKDFGEEGDHRYMPVKLAYFKDMNIDYVLGGHFHSSYSVRTLDNGGYFVYPGSPVSITKKETGRRKVNIFETGKKPTAYTLDTPHYEEVTMILNPFEEKYPLDAVKERIKEVHPAAKVLLRIGGFIDSQKIGLKEASLIDSIKEVTRERCVEEHFEFQDISTILSDDLFKSFQQKLDQGNFDEGQKTQLREFAIRAMMEAKA